MNEQHSAKYDLVKRYYDAGRWSAAAVRAAVPKWITAAEYQQITGEPYEAA